MIVDVFTVVRNEAYMMPYFLRHYQTFADHIYVMDDKSDDGTQEIVTKAGATLLPFPFNRGINENDISQAHADAIIAYSRGKADWVICVDADEFVYYHNGVKTALALADDAGFSLLRCMGYVMISSIVPTEDLQMCDLVKYGVPYWNYCKAIVFDPGLTVHFDPGRHVTHTEPPSIVGNVGLSLLHYRNLSADYYAARIRRNYSRMLDRPREVVEQEMNYRIRRGLEWHKRALKIRERVVV